jgi:hypothetical protein
MNTTADTARARIVEAATAAGFKTDRGYSADADSTAGWSGSKGGKTLHVEFDVRGRLTYAATDSRRITGRDRLGRVLEYLEAAK